MIDTYIKSIAQALTMQHAALMVGAGFSKNADKISVTEKEFLNWNQLADRFYESIYSTEREEIPRYNNPLRLAQQVEVISGRPVLENILKESVPDLDYAPSNLFTKLMELPWVDIFTTNYDTLLERAADKVVSRRYNVVISQDDLVNSSSIPRIIKLHGSFPSQRPFIITEEDYRTYPKKFAAFVNTVQQALLENVFCMIGFSGEDPNFLNWIGWIRDNLGKSNSQKIYMISVNHVETATVKLLLEQNIIVVDLEEKWSEKSICERVTAFLAELEKVVDKKENIDYWKIINRVRFQREDEIKIIVKSLKEVNDSYPGWKYLPWKYKKKVSYLLLDLLELEERVLSKDDIEIKNQLEFVYEYVRFSDIVGRPLTEGTVNRVWNFIAQFEDETDDIKIKSQKIYLQLLRAFRELAWWDKYDECERKILNELLSYDDKQFFYSCKLWKYFYCFDIKTFLIELNRWNLASGDLEWTLQKASMYCIVGKLREAEQMLMENLVLIRQKLLEVESKEYLASLEECYVYLINYIRANSLGRDKLEECKFKIAFPCWETNDRYYYNLNLTGDTEKTEDSIDFYLNRKQSWCYGVNCSKEFVALEFLRFREDIGHPLRIGRVTDNICLPKILELLSGEYSHWCLMQCIVSKNSKNIDFLYGRAVLAMKTQNEIDTLAQRYIKIVEETIQRICEDKENQFLISLFEQIVSIIPDIMSRLMSKCSVRILDLFLNMLLQVCGESAEIKSRFLNVNQMLKTLIQSYTREEQRDRIEQIISFPFSDYNIKDYVDPVKFLCVPEKKVPIKQDIYETTLLELRRELQYNNSEDKDNALNRFVMLNQIIELKEIDCKYLTDLIENAEVPNQKSIGIMIPEKCSKLAAEAFDETLQEMQEDAQKQGALSIGNNNVENIFYWLDYLKLNRVDINKVTEIFKEYLEKYLNYIEYDAFTNAKGRIYTSWFLFLKVSLLSKEENISLNIETIQTLISLYSKALGCPVPLLYKMDFLTKEITTFDLKEFKKNLWKISKYEMGVLKGYIEFLKESGNELKQFPGLIKLWNEIFNYAVYKIFNNETGMLEGIQLCQALIGFKLPESEELEMLLSALEELENCTSFQEEDNENEVKVKLLSRIEACRLASMLYKSGIKEEIVLKWKTINQDTEEFIEIRRIEFEE